MPLSENEQRILRQIEQQLERDPAFSTHGYRMPRHRLVMLSLAVLAALAVTVLSLAVSVWLSLVAFAATLAAAVALEREVRLLAREKVGVLPISAWLGGGRRRRQAEHDEVDET
jgi:Flp pilus assembly protein TadB